MTKAFFKKASVRLAPRKPKIKKFEYLTRQNMLWLYIAGSFIGMVMEGLFCLVAKGQWETHVVSMFAPLCMLYGLGAVGCYVGHCYLHRKNLAVQFFVYLMTATFIELCAGLILEFGLGMRAWDYTGNFLNVRGHICLKASLGWGLIGIVFSKLCANPLNRIFAHMQGRIMRILSCIVAALLIVDLILTFSCLIRWSGRHFSRRASTAYGRWIDRNFGDALMKKRFCEWRFLN